MFAKEFRYLLHLSLLWGISSSYSLSTLYAQEANTGTSKEASPLSIPAKFAGHMENERRNDHFRRKGVHTEVKEEYLPTRANVFALPYIEVPLEDIHSFTTHSVNPDIAKQIIVTDKKGKKYWRYFIHPESLELYAPVIKKYGFKGHYLATPTSATRTLLVWDHKDPSLEPFFMKVSLDKVQFGWGRAIPDHEVRRSVVTSDQIRRMSAERSQQNKLAIMPEVMGAYFDAKWKMPAFIHETQGGDTLQHGMVVRDPGKLFATKEMGDHIYPGFSVFSDVEGHEDVPPLIIQWWKDSGKTWEKFMEQNFLGPIIEGTAYMTMFEGYLPEMHGQNFLVQFDPSKKKVVRVIHRDIGGIRKVDLALRMANGLSVQHLVSSDPLKDFRFQDATKAQLDPYFNWLYPYLFKSSVGHAVKLAKFVPGYDEKAMFNLLRKIMRKYARKWWQRPDGMPLSQALPFYLKNKVVPFKPQTAHLSPSEQKKLAKFIQTQEERGQVVTLPDFSFDPSFAEGNIKKTRYGVIFRAKESAIPHIAVYSTRCEEKKSWSENRLEKKVAQLYSDIKLIADEPVQTVARSEIKSEL